MARAEVPQDSSCRSSMRDNDPSINDGGLSPHILSGAPDSKFLCSVCHLLLRNPVQSFCGHRFCKTCLDNFLRAPEKAKCPACVEEDTENEFSILHHDQVFSDRAIKRELDSLAVHCINDGCTWSGVFQSFEEHERTCRQRPSRGTSPRSQWDIQTIKRYIAEVVSNLEANLRKTESLMEGLTAEQAQTNESLQEFQDQIRALASTLNESRNGEQGSNSTDLRSEEIHESLENMKVKHDAFEQITGVLNQQIEKCLRVLEVMLRQTQQREMAATEQQKLMKTMEAKLTAVERTLLVKDTALADMNIRLQFQELSSYDGTLLWKISDLSKRMQDAKSGKITSFYSPCFYTSRQGYRMCLRVYLNGDGMGKGSHISLFFVVMRGTYDALLPWPFRQKVTFMLLDQKRREHIIDAFRPDPSSSSFKRPVTEMNIASGCPLFMAISQLQADGHEYVKDDTMFIRVIVDISDLN